MPVDTTYPLWTGLLATRWSIAWQSAKTRRLAIFGITIVGLLPWLFYLNIHPEAADAHAYYAVDLDNMYGGAFGTADAYLYSPVFAQVIEPLRWLGWDGFRNVWRLLELGAMTVMGGPWIGPAFFATPFTLEYNFGNIHPFLALAVVAGFRWPAAWAFVLLTKVTPGVGLLWFAVRREWRNLAIALGATAAIAGVSFVANPGAWFEWFANLVPRQLTEGYTLTDAPLVARLVGAALLVVWGARTDRRWTVLVAAFLALPAIWQHALTMSLGLWWLTARSGSPGSNPP